MASQPADVTRKSQTIHAMTFAIKKARPRKIWLLVESNNFFATTLFSQTVNGKALALDKVIYKLKNCAIIIAMIGLYNKDFQNC